MPQCHQANLLYGARDLRLEFVSTTPPGPGEVQIAPRATGLCGTDLHYYAAGKNGTFIVTDPLVLGHEFAGEVVAVGPDVTAVRPGARVVVEPQRPCFKCRTCRQGRNNLCALLKFTGSASSQPPVQGSLQQLYNHPADLVYPLPDSISFSQGALVEPLSVAIHAVRRSGLYGSQHVLITGAGAIGLLCAAVARSIGVSSITMIDVEASRLEFARRNGFADAIYHAPLAGGADESKADFAARLAQEAKTVQIEPPDVSFECTGVETCANVCLYSAARGGKVVIVGMGKPLQEISLGAAAVREVDIISVWRYANTFPTAIELLQSGKIKVDSLITHEIDFMNARDAFEMIESRPKDLVKCIIISAGNTTAAKEL